MSFLLFPFLAVSDAFDWQALAALLVVAAAVTWLLWRSLGSKKSSGCGGGACPAVSPEVKALKKQVSKRGRM